MPDNYSNPDIFPGKGSYTWVPNTTPTIGNLNALNGFSLLEIEKGAFRNYYYNSSEKNNIGISTGSGNLSKNQPYYPIRNCTRPLQLGPSTPLNLSGLGGYYVSAPISGGNEVLIWFELKNNKRLSSIDFTYDLCFSSTGNIFSSITSDPIFNQSGGAQAISDLSTGNYAGFIAFLVSNNYNFIDICSYNISNNTSTNLKVNNQNVGLPLTRVNTGVQFSDPTYPGSGIQFSNINVKLNVNSGQYNKDRNCYNTYQAISLKVNDNIKQWLSSSADLILTLQNLRFYTADRVNFTSNPAQLPASALGYSMNLNFLFQPTGSYLPTIAVSGGSIGVSAVASFAGIFWVPADLLQGRASNISVKVFNPLKTTNSEGFAHSLALHLIILSFPIFGPLGNALLPGVVEPYWAVLIGPSPFYTQLNYTGTSKLSNTKGQIATISLGNNSTPNGTLVVTKNGVPLNENNPINIFSFSDVVSANTNFDQSINGNYLEYPVNDGISDDVYVNIYTGIDGRVLQSVNYSGSHNRSKNSYFYAYDSLPLVNYQTSLCAYQSYVALKDPSKLEKLFSTNPIMIFKLSNTDYMPSLILYSGFLSTSINAYVSDPSGIFDTKLVYRFYFVSRTDQQSSNPDFSPTNPNSIKNHIKVDITDPNYPTLVVAAFDSSWTFDNVLVSGNLDNILNKINTEIFINPKTPDYNFFQSAPNYDIFCAVYSISTLNDTVSKIYASKLSTLSSLSFPITTISLQSNFLINFPIFYQKSYQNGGYLQAQRDTGYAGSYAPDSNTYTVYSTLYSGQSFDNTKPYYGKVNIVSGLTGCLIIDYNSSSSQQNFFTDLSAGTADTPSITELDFVFILQNSPEDAKISSNSNSAKWNLSIQKDKNNTPNNVSVRYEIDLLDNQYKFIQNVAVSSTKVLSFDKSGNIDIAIQYGNIPYYLSKNGSYLILKIFFYNFSKSTVVGFNKISLTKNLINYLSLTNVPGLQAPSPGFYEDLPIQPNGFVSGSNQFFFKIDYTSLSNDTGTFIFDPTIGFNITGVLYSPTWALDNTFPSGMEVTTKSHSVFPDFKNATTGGITAGVTPYQIFFRTGQASLITVTDTKKHGLSKMIVTVTNQQSNESANSVLTIISEGYNRSYLTQSTISTPLANQTLNTLNIKNPMLSSSSELILQGNVNQYSSNGVVSFNIEDPIAGTAQQFSPPGNLSPINVPQSVKYRLKNCSFADFDYKNQTTYSIGVTESGALIYCKDDTLTAVQPAHYLQIEGNPNAQDITSDPSITGISSTLAQGIVNQSYPGICVNSANDVLVFYVYQSTKTLKANSSIYVRVVNGSNLLNPIEVFDFADFISKISSSQVKLTINQLSVCKDDIYEYGKFYYLCFDCNSKLFFAKIIYEHSSILLIDLAILYGNLQSSTKDTFTLSLNTIIQKGYLKRFDYSTSQSGTIGSYEIGTSLGYLYDKDLSNSQRVGILDFDGFYIGVQFTDNLLIKEILFEKTYLLPAVLRIIGHKSG